MGCSLCNNHHKDNNKTTNNINKQPTTTTTKTKTTKNGRRKKQNTTGQGKRDCDEDSGQDNHQDKVEDRKNCADLQRSTLRRIYEDRRRPQWSWDVFSYIHDDPWWSQQLGTAETASAKSALSFPHTASNEEIPTQIAESHYQLLRLWMCRM